MLFSKHQALFFKLTTFTLIEITQEIHCCLKLQGAGCWSLPIAFNEQECLFEHLVCWQHYHLMSKLLLEMPFVFDMAGPIYTDCACTTVEYAFNCSHMCFCGSSSWQGARESSRCVKPDNNNVAVKYSSYGKRWSTVVFGLMWPDCFFPFVMRLGNFSLALPDLPFFFLLCWGRGPSTKGIKQQLGHVRETMLSLSTKSLSCWSCGS